MLFYFNIVQSYHIAVMKAVRGRLCEGLLSALRRNGIYGAYLRSSDDMFFNFGCEGYFLYFTTTIHQSTSAACIGMPTTNKSQKL